MRTEDTLHDRILHQGTRTHDCMIASLHPLHRLHRLHLSNDWHLPFASYGLAYAHTYARPQRESNLTHTLAYTHLEVGKEGIRYDDVTDGVYTPGGR